MSNLTMIYLSAKVIDISLVRVRSFRSELPKQLGEDGDMTFIDQVFDEKQSVRLIG